VSLCQLHNAHGKTNENVSAVTMATFNQHKPLEDEPQRLAAAPYLWSPCSTAAPSKSQQQLFNSNTPFLPWASS